MSNPDKCTAGLTFGVRFKLDDAASNYKDEPHYIVDSGGSSKESRGFTLFLKDSKLYAVVSVPDEVWRVSFFFVFVAFSSCSSSKVPEFTSFRFLLFMDRLNRTLISMLGNT